MSAEVHVGCHRLVVWRLRTRWRSARPDSHAKSCPMRPLGRCRSVPFAGEGHRHEPRRADQNEAPGDIPIKQMYVIPKATICANLEASGFPCDSMPDAITSRLLANLAPRGLLRRRHRDEEPALATRRTPASCSRATTAWCSRFPRSAATSSATSRRRSPRRFSTLRKQLPDERTCETKLAAGDAAGAIAAAKAAITAYPQSTIGRVCLANALLKQNASPDSVIAVASKVVEIDPRSRPALIMLGDAVRREEGSQPCRRSVDQVDRRLSEGCAARVRRS